MTLITTDDETFTVSLDSLDVKAVHLGALVQKMSEFTSLVTINNVTLISTNEELAIGQPAMARVVTADMLFLLVQARALHLHVVCVLELEVLEGL